MVRSAVWILDVSVAAKWFLRDEGLLTEADRVLAQLSAGALNAVAPAYFHDEAANILRTAVRRGRLTSVDAQRHYAEFLVLDIEMVEPTPGRHTTALRLALTHNIAYYDALYLQLAQQLNLPLLTADLLLHTRIVTAFPTAIYLGSL